jgi:two-component system CheB/CheR fusion protein
LTEPRELRGTVMVVFTDVTVDRTAAEKGSKEPRVSRSARLDQLEEELARSREEVQSVREEMQTSQEELKSTNEELQSTNEELQSTNEELTTSKEEMQSLNEELQTVNHELQAKVDELSRSNNDMKNLLNSTDIATLFLDPELRVRRFTPPTVQIIKLIPGDAGRPITDIASELEYPGLADDAREVLRTLVFKERQAKTREDRWFSVRIMPYRTLENVIDGVVITFTDVSSARTLEASLRDQAGELRQLADSLPALVWGCRSDGACDYVSRQWSDYTGVPDVEELGWAWLEQIHPEDRERAREEWRAAVKAGKRYDIEVRIRRADGAYRWFNSRASPIRDSHGLVLKWYGTCTDVDDLKRADEERTVIGSTFSTVLDGMNEGYIALDRQRMVRRANRAAARILGHEGRDIAGKPFFEVFPTYHGSLLDQKLGEAVREKASLSFGLDFGAKGRYHVRLDARGDRGDVIVLLSPDVDGARAR